MIFSQIKMAMTIILLVGISGAVIYVMKLRSDNAILKANQVKLEAAVETQKEALEQQIIPARVMPLNQPINMLEEGKVE